MNEHLFGSSCKVTLVRGGHIGIGLGSAVGIMMY